MGVAEEIFREVLADNSSPTLFSESNTRVGCPGCLRLKTRWVVYQDILTCAFCYGRYQIYKLEWPDKLLSTYTMKISCPKCHHSIYKVTGKSLECCYCHSSYQFSGGLTLKALAFKIQVPRPKTVSGFSRSSIYRALKQPDPASSK